MATSQCIDNHILNTLGSVNTGDFHIYNLPMHRVIILNTLGMV
jgi:hypothetical protein